MKHTFFILVTLLVYNISNSQTVIKMKKQGGVSVVPCKVNGLDLSFIFDTGASDVTLSLTEAIFMLKHGYLSKKDIIGTANYSDANGDINEGVTIILKEIEFAGLRLFNIKATIVKNLDAPLLLGQTAISKLGTIQLDLATNTLTILNGKSNYDYSANTSKPLELNERSVSQQTESKEILDLWKERQREMKETGAILRESADETSRAIYWVPKDSKVVLVEKLKSFAKISFNDKTGYITLADFNKFFAQ